MQLFEWKTADVCLGVDKHRHWIDGHSGSMYTISVGFGMTFVLNAKIELLQLFFLNSSAY